MSDTIDLSPLGFGCAPIMGKVGRQQALRAMAEAFNLGVTHFDVARSYGFGRAEQVVGAFMKGRRDKMTITSKFGVVPPQLGLKTRAMIPVARALTQCIPQLKTRLKSKSGQLLANRNFDPDYARLCLDQSLREMATDYVDIYLLHEPSLVLMEGFDELRSFLEESVCNGKIRRWGFAYRLPQDHEWADNFGGHVIQFEGNLHTLPSCGQFLNDRHQHIVMRPFGGGDGMQHAIAHNPDLALALQELGASFADFSLCLAYRLSGNSGSVVCSMFSSAHIQKNAHSIGLFSQNRKMLDIVDGVLSTYGCSAAKGAKP